MRVSYLEIYNEQCYDLLDIGAQPSDIAIIEDSKDRVIVKGLAVPEVHTEAEALQHLFEVPLPCQKLSCMQWCNTETNGVTDMTSSLIWLLRYSNDTAVVCLVRLAHVCLPTISKLKAYMMFVVS